MEIRYTGSRFVVGWVDVRAMGNTVADAAVEDAGHDMDAGKLTKVADLVFHSVDTRLKDVATDLPAVKPTGWTIAPADAMRIVKENATKHAAAASTRSSTPVAASGFDQLATAVDRGPVWVDGAFMDALGNPVAHDRGVIGHGGDRMDVDGFGGGGGHWGGGVDLGDGTIWDGI